MANSTKHGFVTPEYSDPAAVPAAIATNNAALVTALNSSGVKDPDTAIAEIKRMFTEHLIDEDAITVFMLYDWDDTVIGVIPVPTGHDPRPYINEYVKNNLIHPDLRNQTAEQLASDKRADTYRGEYPYTGPDPEDPLATGGENTVTDGGDYPLTNKLDYSFIRSIDADYPYCSGWVEVTDETMADTFTALEYGEEFTPVDFTKFSGGGHEIQS